MKKTKGMGDDISPLALALSSHQSGRVLGTPVAKEEAEAIWSLNTMSLTLS